MKSLFRLFLLILFFINMAAYSAPASNTNKPPVFGIVVLPVDVMDSKENYYSFPEASEIVSNDVIEYFNKSGKVLSPDLYAIREKLQANPALKSTLYSAIRKYRTSNTIDYQSFKQIAQEFDSKSVLLVSSSVTTKENSLKRSLWEILEVSSVFDISYPFVFETNAVLIDTVNDIVMWSGINKKSITNVEGFYSADNFAQANAHYEHLKMYSKDILALDISQNVVLRFFPKTIRPVESKNNGDSIDGTIFKFDKLIPQQKIERTESNIGPGNYGEMIFGI